MTATMETENEWSRRCVNSPGPGQNPVEVLTMSDVTCSVDECSQPVSRRGWCEKHYRRWTRSGDATAGRRSPEAEPSPTCVVDGCSAASKTRSMCAKHYTRLLRHGDPMAVRGKILDAEPQFDPPKADGSCSIPNCSSPADGNGWCSKHYARWQRHGDPLVVHGYIGGVPEGCSIEGCDRKFYARTWCRFHYKRWNLKGDANWQPMTLAERFWQYVDPPATFGGCWEWGGFSHGPHGSKLRGWFSIDNKPRSAYRVAYELMVGPIPEGLDLDHLCRNPICVNPAHLDAVDNRENIRRHWLPFAEHRAIVPAHLKEPA